MTSRLLTPWCRTRPRSGTARSDPGTPGYWGTLAATPLLDWQSAEIRSLLDEVTMQEAAGVTDRALLQQAHALISRRVRPVYALDDEQPASQTVRLRRGSCSQRLAVLEAVARAAGIATRVRGLLVDGTFWYPRFPRLKFVVPQEVLLAWPEFLLDDVWVSASELFGPVSGLPTATAFTNQGSETLFDAIARSGVDWDGHCSACDLSHTVLHDLGRFDSRDQLFAQHAQTLCRPARTLGNPVLGRWSAGASAATRS